MPLMSVGQKLGGKALRGGIHLVLRQIFSAGLSLVSILVLARVLGPQQYGIVAIALGIFYFLIWTSKLGLHVYLIRQPDLPQDAPAQVLAFFNTVGAGFCLLLWAAAPLFGSWTGQQEITGVMRWLPLPVWCEMVASVAISLLERELNFARVGLIETVAQTCNSGLAIALVLSGWNYWGPIAGLIVQYVLLVILAHLSRPVSWRWRWHSEVIHPALRYGLTFTGSDWILSLRLLTVPLFVSRLLGVEAAGIASIAVRLVDQLALLRIVTRRLSISVLAKLTGQPARIRQAISRGMAYQAMLVGLVCAGFSCCAAWLIPLMFGAEWLPSVQLYPLVALAGLVGSLFDLHTSALYAAGHNREVARLNAVCIGVIWLMTWLLLPLLNVWGYGIAELMAIPCYGLIHQSLTQLCGTPDYRNALWLVLAATPALLLGPWLPTVWGLGLLALGYGVVLAIPDVRRVPFELIEAWRSR